MKRLAIVIGIIILSVPSEAQNQKCNTLMNAVRIEDKNLVEQCLLNTRPNCSERGVWEPRSPLGIAAYNGNEEIAELLISSGADVNYLGKGDASALMIAAENTHLGLVQLLIDAGADVNAEVKGDGTPLMAAIKGNHKEIIELLLDKGANPMLGTDGDGNSLITLGKTGTVETYKLLRSNSNIDLNKSSEGDGSPLIQAVRSQNLALVKEIISQGADVNMGVEGDGSPLIEAAKAGNLEIVAYLIDAGADVNIHIMGDETPLIQAAWKGHLEVVKYLVDKGANVNMKCKDAYRLIPLVRTALSMAMENEQQDIVDYLFSVGATE